MDNVEILFNKVDEAICIMKEVAAWGRSKGFRVWLDEWLEKDRLVTKEAKPENFCVGKLDGESVCAFILQWSDTEYWPDAPEYEAVYLHKFCVRREFAHRGMTKSVIEAVKVLCKKKKIKYIRLDTGLEEKVIRKLYLDAGFKIVNIIDYGNGHSVALYELEAVPCLAG